MSLSRYRGEFEKRMQKLLKELAGLRDEVRAARERLGFALGVIFEARTEDFRRFRVRVLEVLGCVLVLLCRGPGKLSEWVT